MLSHQTRQGVARDHGHFARYHRGHRRTARRRSIGQGRPARRRSRYWVHDTNRITIREVQHPARFDVRRTREHVVVIHGVAEIQIEQQSGDTNHITRCRRSAHWLGCSADEVTRDRVNRLTDSHHMGLGTRVDVRTLGSTLVARIAFVVADVADIAVMADIAETTDIVTPHSTPPSGVISINRVSDVSCHGAHWLPLKRRPRCQHRSRSGEQRKHPHRDGSGRCSNHTPRAGGGERLSPERLTRSLTHLSQRRQGHRRDRHPSDRDDQTHDHLGHERVSDRDRRSIEYSGQRSPAQPDIQLIKPRPGCTTTKSAIRDGEQSERQRHEDHADPHGAPRDGREPSCPR